MIELEVNGNPYTDFVSASATLALDTPANDFTFVASAVKGFPPFKADDEVKVLVDRTQVMVGYIDTVEGEEAEGSHLVTYSGRDRTQDFIDSDINVLNEIRAAGNLTLKRLIELVIENLEQDLLVIDEFNPPPFNSAEDIVVPKVGENALDFVLFYASKRQALLTSNSNGDILITSSSPVSTEQILQLVDGGDNNIIAQTWEISANQRFNQYVARGQLDPIGLNLTPSPDIAGVESQGGRVTDSEIRSGRQKVITEGKGYSSEQLKNRAKWSQQLAKARATRFSCSVKGHSKDNGEIWAFNELIHINSHAADITREMLVNTVTFSEEEGAKTTTSLEFVEKNAYTIDAKLLSQKKVGKQNNAYWLP